MTIQLLAHKGKLPDSCSKPRSGRGSTPATWQSVQAQGPGSGRKEKKAGEFGVAASSATFVSACFVLSQPHQCLCGSVSADPGFLSITFIKFLSVYFYQ